MYANFSLRIKANWTNFKKMQWENISCPFIRPSVANLISCLREAVLRSPAPAAHELSLNNILNPDLLCHWCVGARVQLVTADDQVAMYEWVWRGECWSSIKHFEGSSWLEKCYINTFHRPVQIYTDYWNFKTAASPAENLHVWLWSRFNPKRPPQLLLAFEFYIPEHQNLTRGQPGRFGGCHLVCQGIVQHIEFLGIFFSKEICQLKMFDCCEPVFNCDIVTDGPNGKFFSVILWDLYCVRKNGKKYKRI